MFICTKISVILHDPKNSIFVVIIVNEDWENLILW